MENLGTDILENILFRLPVDAGIQAERVCTTWRAVLRNKKPENPGLIFAHFVDWGCKVIEKLFYEDEYDHYTHSKTINYYTDNIFTTEIEQSRFIAKSVPKNVMVGSCNGLICFGKYHTNYVDRFLICNLLTGESVFLPEFDFSEFISAAKSPSGRLTSGFGYCPSTNVYKVVTIIDCEEEQGGHVLVYTVGTGKWRYIGFTDHCALNYSSGIYANGALFWLHQTNRSMVHEVHEILAFDLGSDKFHCIALPHSKDFGEIDYTSPIHLLGGNNNLYLVHKMHGNFSRVDIWVHKRDNTDTRTSYTLNECNGEQNYQIRISSHWLKEFSMRLDFANHFKPIAITRSNAVLFYYWMGMRLYWYDSKTSTLNKLRDDNTDGTGRFVGNLIAAVPHTHSIVSLKDLGETNVTYLKDLEKYL